MVPCPRFCVAQVLAEGKLCESLVSSVADVLDGHHQLMWPSLQEFLRCCNSTGPNAPAAVEQVSCPSAQGMVPKSRSVSCFLAGDPLHVGTHACCPY